MYRKKESLLFAAFLAVFVTCLIPSIAISDTFTATWTNTNDTGLWSEPGNWDIGSVPLNDTDIFNVVIPAGFTVNFDIDIASSVTDLSLASSSTLIIEPGHSLAVLDDGDILGTVRTSGSGTNFICTSDGAVLSNGARIATTSGSSVQYDATAYSSTSLNNNYTLFSADGLGTTLLLSELMTLDARFTSTYKTHTISAANHGVIDMSSLGSLYGANHSTSLLKLHIDSGGFINLNSLTDISGGYTKFDIDVPTYTLPLLANANHTTFKLATAGTLELPALQSFNNGLLNIADDSEINAPALTSFTNSQVILNPLRGFTTAAMTDIDNSRFILTDGVQFGTSLGNIATTSYASTGMTLNATLFSAEGTDTLMDLSSLKSFDARYTGTYKTQTVSAASNGNIDLSSVETLYGMVHSTSRLKFHVDSEGMINLDSLIEIPSGYSTFDIDIMSFDLPLLQSTSNTNFDASSVTIIDLPKLTSFHNASMIIADGGTINAPALTSFTNSNLTLNPTRGFNTADLVNIDNSKISLTESAIYGSAITANSYASTGVTTNSTLFSADGSNTVLDLSSLQNFNAMYTGTYKTQTISATNNALIDLSSVENLYGLSHSTSRLRLHIDGDGDIDLSSLVEIPAGYCNFDINIPLYILPLLQSVTGTTFDASNITTIDLPELTDFTNGLVTIADGGTVNAPLLTSFTNSTIALKSDTSFITAGLSDIDNTRITVSAGAEFGTATGDITATSYSSTGLSNFTLFSVNGASTILDMSSVQSLDARNTGTYRTQNITVTNNAMIDFSNLGFIYGLTHSTSKLQINLDGAAEMYVGNDLEVSNYATFNVSGADTTLTVDGNLSLNIPSRFYASEAATININGDFLFAQNDEVNFNTDTAIFQFANATENTLEVAGENLGIGPVASNFGMAQLIVGSDSVPTKVKLVDLIDNGNRNGEKEALYLYGSGGLSGLRIKAGSKLIIGDINVYAFIDAEMVHVNDLFGPDTKYIAYDEGTISITDFDCSLKADLNGDCFVDLRDFATLASEWLQSGIN